MRRDFQPSRQTLRSGPGRGYLASLDLYPAAITSAIAEVTVGHYLSTEEVQHGRDEMEPLA